MEPDLKPGRIVWAEISDPNGFAKARPAVVIRSSDDENQPIIVAAITSQIPLPLPDDYFELPWHAQGHPKTKLNRRSAVVCSWVDILNRNTILDFGGIVLEPQLKQVLEMVERYLDKDVPSSDSPSSSDEPME